MQKLKSKKQSSTAGRKRVTFHFKAHLGSTVYLSGSFNNWNGNAKEMNDGSGNGEYFATLFLPPGKYEYKFIVNGEWHVDPECPNWEVNDLGTLNSIITIG